MFVMKVIKVLGVGLIFGLVVGLFSGCDSKNIVTTSDDSSYVKEYKECEETVDSSTEVSSNLVGKDDEFISEDIQNLTEKVMASLEQLKSIESENSKEETIISDNTTTQKETPTTTKSKESTTTKKITTTTKKATTNNYKPTTTKTTNAKKPTTKPTVKSTTTQSDKVLYYYQNGTTGYEPKPGAEYQRYDGAWDVIPEGKIIYEYEDGSLGYVYKTNSVYYDSLYVDPNEKVLFYYDDGTIGYEPKPGARYKANGVWQVVSWGNDLTDEEIKEAHKNDSHGPWY